MITKNISSTRTNTSYNSKKSLSFYIGLTLAGTASSFLTCLFSLFHLQVFLQAYQLPLHVYSVGSSIFAVINTANDVAGAWLVDSLAAASAGRTNNNNNKGKPKSRHEWVGWSGCLFALCFLTPFFRYKQPAGTLWDGGHFVTSLSLYDTMFSFHCILLGSIVSDHSGMSDRDRVLFLALGKGLNMLAPVVVAKAGLAVFDVDNLQPLRRFLILIAVIVCGISLFAQHLLTPQQYSWLGFCGGTPKTKVDKEEEDDDDDDAQEQDSFLDEETTSSIKPLEIKQVAKDFWSHPNFRYWILMEMLLEGQTTFQKSFMKTFVDQLLLLENSNNAAANNVTTTGALSKSTCDWFLSSRPTIVGLTSLALYIPIQRYGYAKMYSAIFVCNIALSLMVLMTVGWSLDEESSAAEDHAAPNTIPIFLFLLIQPVLLGAMGGAGFGLAMADMVLEMKCDHAAQGRWDEPSLAGMFMGVNALFCKPTESILPIVTATLLGATDFSESSTTSTTTATASKSTQTVLYRLLILPPLICSVIQLCVWSRYSLHPQRTQVLRKELESMNASHENDKLMKAKAKVNVTTTV